MILNEKWDIIPRELEAEEIIYQNNIKHDYHLKVNPTENRLRNPHMIGTISRKISIYFKCPTYDIRTSKPWKTM